MKVLGIITARGGSKGIPGKNIVDLGGKPLIEYTLKAAADSKLMNDFLVSTDDPEIAEVCERLGFPVPFMRPEELAADDTPTLPVLINVLENVEKEYDAVMILQPTSPFRTSADIDKAIEMLEKNGTADSVISVVKVGDNHPARMKQIEKGVLIDPPFAESVEGLRRQELPDLYLRNGAIYLTRTAVLTEKKSIKGDVSLAYVMPEENSVNIDAPLDLIIAEALLSMRMNDE